MFLRCNRRKQYDKSHDYGRVGGGTTPAHLAASAAARGQDAQADRKRSHTAPGVATAQRDR